MTEQQRILEGDDEGERATMRDERDLDVWWRRAASDDIDKTVPKIEEYGNRDLEAMGRVYGIMHDVPMSPSEAAVYGCMFYALGKVMRAIAALERGEMPSEDTLFDLSVYSMMARSYQERGKL